MGARGSLVVLAAIVGLVGASPASAQLRVPTNGELTIVNVGQGSGEVHLIDLFLFGGPQTKYCFNLGPGDSCTSRFLVAPYYEMGIEAYPADDSYVAGWSFPCHAPDPYGSAEIFFHDCHVHLDVLNTGGLKKRFEVNFARQYGQVQVSKLGTGGGEIRSEPGNIACTQGNAVANDNCWENFFTGTTVTLTAIPRRDGSRFVGWSGKCGGTGACVLSVAGNVFNYGDVVVPPVSEVQGTFERPSLSRPPRTNQPPPQPMRTLLADRRGDGDGDIRSVPGSDGIACGQDCREAFPDGRRLLLRAIAAAGSRFVSWGPACPARSTTCRITMNANRRVTATFARSRGQLQVVAEPGGEVTSVPNGIVCSTRRFDCTKQFPEGSSVFLAPEPDDGFAFAGWSGACTGTTACLVRMDGNKTVTARFVDVHNLQVSRDGTGAGTITVRSPDREAECNVGCGQFFTQGTIVRVEAQPQQGSSFAGFSGACTGTGDCVVTMDAERSVGVRFDAPPDVATLTVGLFGAGQGRVTSNPGGIDCRPDCLEPFTLGTRVTLTARPENGSVAGGFAGCAGVQGRTCAVQLDRSRQILVVFDVAAPQNPDPPVGASPPPDTAPQVGTAPAAAAAGDVAVAARIRAVRSRRSGRRRLVRVTLVAQERVTGTARVSRSGRTLSRRRVVLRPGRPVITLRVRPTARAGRARLALALRDGAGNRRTLRRAVRVPR